MKQLALYFPGPWLRARAVAAKAAAVLFPGFQSRIAIALRIRIGNYSGTRMNAAVCFATAFCLFAAQGQAQEKTVTDAPREAVRNDGGRIVTPVNQIVSPAGRQLDLPGMRPQALVLSPDGAILATSGKSHELVIVDPASWKILQQISLPAIDTNKAASSAGSAFTRNLTADNKAELSFTGLIFSADGSRIYLSDVQGSIKVFAVDHAHHVEAIESFRLPPANAPDRAAEIPSGLALSQDGAKLYVVANLGNKLLELDAQTGKSLRDWPTGTAPYGVVLVGQKAFVSNWGGRQPEAHSVTGPAGRGTKVRVDSTRYIASEGSVTVVDLQSGKTNEIMVGRHASALALSPNGKFLVVANAADDTLSVLDVKTGQVTETISARVEPADLFGASPNALTFDSSGKWLFVCNGSQNAVAVIEFKPGQSKWRGLVPVGWYPGAIVWDKRHHELDVANIKGIRPAAGPTPTFNTHQYYGSLTQISDPAGSQLARWTRQALAGIRYPKLHEAALPARSGVPPQPVPERVGEPSVFQHVIYIIKENRTYDQVLGDVTTGNGQSNLCVFGERVTPNQHKLVRDFTLLDNTYCCGILSADGHQWADSAIATDYMEKSFASFPRSYPDGMDEGGIDALAYSPSGFIWDNCVAHKKSIHDFGEFAISKKFWVDSNHSKRVRFLDAYRAWEKGENTIGTHSEPAIESLRGIVDSTYPGWDLSYPDVGRAAIFTKDLAEAEKRGSYPAFTLICLPNDHTSGTGPNAPTPGAQVADNDLALGRIVDAVSHSSFWATTCVFVIEDDPQAGWDHVSGYRTTAYVASPYTKRGATVSVQYNQTSILRTMELMLGLPPMNQMDATATPMTDCFNAVPDLTPFVAVTNNVPLDEMNPGARKISDATLRRDARISARLPLKKPDQCPEDTLNKIIWRAMRGSADPYPAWAVTAHDDD